MQYSIEYGINDMGEAERHGRSPSRGQATQHRTLYATSYNLHIRFANRSIENCRGVKSQCDFTP